MWRFWWAGLKFPPRPLRTHGDPADPLQLGDVMIHRLHFLVAWPVGSDWRTRRPCPWTTQ